MKFLYFDIEAAQKSGYFIYFICMGVNRTQNQPT